MDFITQLPKTEAGYDSVMVAVEQLSKRAHFVVGYTTDTAEDVAVRYQKEIFRLHGLSDLVLSDRDSKFTSRFWSKLCGLLGYSRSSQQLFVPKEIESRNAQILENYYREFSNAASKDEHAFELGTDFAVGNEVLLAGDKLAPFHLGTTKRKLGARWIGPYSIAEKLGREYYRLALPPKLRLHPVFHTSLLNPYISFEHQRSRQRLFKVQLPDGGEGELVEDIFNHKKVGRRTLYEVK
ncbi:hypothetical protein PHMEG_0007612 [Phytophthora megakarya]|uniref:Tf2-1-like SH3-like domain-containing protein n=1 Tax=Phytophthora megakarya TaxID=4795 RepID=A0A225WM11_9STRA|nr:hypothetical protein PHMEG_0007612 [Phytophthora megakarya]